MFYLKLGIVLIILLTSAIYVTQDYRDKNDTHFESLYCNGKLIGTSKRVSFREGMYTLHKYMYALDRTDPKYRPIQGEFCEVKIEKNP